MNADLESTAKLAIDSAEPAMPATLQRVVYVLDVAEKPGILHSIASVFAHRGLSIRALVADAGRGPPRILVAFHGTPRQCRLVGQVLPRLHDVHSVRILAEESPELHAVAVCHTTAPVPPLSGVNVQALGDAILLTGSYAAVENAVEQLERGGSLREVFRSLVAS